MPQPPKLILPAGRSSIGKPESWPLSPEAARTLAQVGPSSIPILCLECSGPAFGRIIGAVHQASRRSRLEHVDLAREGSLFTPALPRGRDADALTLALDGLEHLDVYGQSTLQSYLDEAAPRLISATQVGLAELSRVWRPDLLALLSAVTVTTPSLANRALDIVGLAEERMASLCVELARSPSPTFAPAAKLALEGHDWPGDVAELDAVLLQTILRCDSETIDAADLVWSLRAPEPLSSGPSVESEAPAVPVDPREDEAEAPGELEAVAIELAHQLKNPLVTIKTFVDSATRLEPGPDLDRFRDLTGEAITRIDDGLEELLAFSRLGPLAPVRLDVVASLEAALGSAEAAFERKEATIAERPSGRLEATAGAEHLRFALGALVRHVAEVIEPRSELRISVPAESRLRLSYRECGTASHLRGVISQPASSFPVALLLVRGALTRMGGGMRTERAENRVTIELGFPGI